MVKKPTMNDHLRRGIDIKQIIMGEELCDALAQRLYYY